MRSLYQIAIHLFILGMRIASLFNKKIKKGIQGRKNWRNSLDDIPKDANVIWFHCASLGEFDQGLPVMSALKKNTPNAFILLTFFSPSGLNHYHKREHPVDLTIYLPFDTKSNARTFLKKTNPTLALFVKYEFWPNFISECKRAKVKTFSISTLLRSSQVYFKWYGGFFANVLKSIDHFFVQNAQTKELLDSIGVKQIEISGDTRYDKVIQHKNSSTPTDSVLSQFAAEGPILIAGSTWEVEEKIIKKFLESNTKTKVIIAPHNINSNNIERIQSLLDCPSVRYTKYEEYQGNRVLILDTIGHLTSAYQYADYAFIGGGFSGNLHNVLEPAVYGLPVFFGPHHQKFPEAHSFIDGGIGFEVENAEQLSEKINNLGDQQELKQKIEGFIQSQSGATDKIVNHSFITNTLKQK
ncbi:3-deoxy-D-manno-octulosonic acid transferase [Crocinitomicaceae bacterium]|nr:3-deoxy-D-manno-octulosonic acid transferase [Crocinitomicaceae bacterium]